MVKNATGEIHVKSEPSLFSPVELGNYVRFNAENFVII